MIHFTMDELRSSISNGPVSLDEGLLIEGFNLLDLGNNMIWSTVDTLERDVEMYCLDRGWNPETALVFYERPRSSEEVKAAQETKELIEDWDDIQIGSVDPNEVAASVVPNMTKERFVEVLLKPFKLKAFL